MKVCLPYHFSRPFGSSALWAGTSKRVVFRTLHLEHSSTRKALLTFGKDNDGPVTDL